MAESILYGQIREYLDRGLLPMHMPGHKRNRKSAAGLPYEWDLTEVEGTDDLHHPEGILREAMDRAAALFGARETFFLVNGSTCGILSAVGACLPPGGTILAAGGCHRSVFHAIELGGLLVRFPESPFVEDFGICGSIPPSRVEEMLEKYPDIGAVILTSPTYEGVVSDIRSIAEICRGRGVPLIVDEAHGAHLGLSKGCGFPESAVRLGADLVVQSPHKTLGSLTQTALLHICSDRIPADMIRRQLDIYETSSPSYPLMVSLDECVCTFLKEGKEIFGDWAGRLSEFEKETADLKRIRILTGKEEGIYAFDKSKILMDFRNLGLTGQEAADRLRRDFGIETEMSQGTCVLAMTGAFDREDALKRLARALLEMDGLEGTPLPRKASPAAWAFHDREAVRISGALWKKTCTAAWESAAGRISAEYVYCYPPGIPLLLPGERISRERAEQIRELKEKGVLIRQSGGLRGGEGVLVLLE